MALLRYYCYACYAVHALRCGYAEILRLLANFNFVTVLLRLRCGCDGAVSRSCPLPIGWHDSEHVDREPPTDSVCSVTSAYCDRGTADRSQRAIKICRYVNSV